MEILFYSHFYKPETGAASVRADYFIKSLRNSGHEVLIVAPKPNYPLGKIFKGYENKIIVKDSQNNIVYLPILFVGSHSPIGRLFSYLSYFICSLFYLLPKKYNPDIVISSSPPIFTSLAAILYSKFKKSKFIFDIRDIWPDIGIELAILKNAFLIAGLRKIERYLLEQSDKIIVTAEGDKNNILEKLSNKSKCDIIFNGADTDIFKPVSPADKIKIRKRYDIPIDKKIAIYFGSYNHGMNDIEILKKLFTDERIINKNIHFLSIGSGDNLHLLIKSIHEKLTFSSFESLPMEEVAVLLSSSDISVIPRKIIKNDTGGNIPVKCFESWAAGVPVLLSNIKDTDITKIFYACGAGKLVPAENIEELVKAFINILDGYDDKLVNARQYVMDNFDRKKQSEKISSIVSKLTNGI